MVVCGWVCEQVYFCRLWNLVDALVCVCACTGVIVHALVCAVCGSL